MKKIPLRPNWCPRTPIPFESQRIAPSCDSLDAIPQIGMSEETPDFFAKKFNKDSSYIEEKLQLLNETFEERPNYFEVDASNAVDMFAVLSEDIKRLQNYLTKSKEFLPDYKVKQSQTKITDLSNNYDETRKRILPKKKFGFKARKKSAAPSSKSEVDKGKEKEDAEEEQKEKKEESAPEYPKDVLWPERSRHDYIQRKSLNVNTIEERKNEYILYDGKGANNFDVNIVDLENCFVELRGHISTIRISNLLDCVILAGPVKFSIYAEKCRNTTLALSCQQLRLHESTKCTVFLHVSTRAIMEQCSNIFYGEYNYNYPNIEHDFEILEIDRTVNNYKKIIDFNYLSTTAPSPNVKFLEPNTKQDWDKLRNEFQTKIGSNEAEVKN